MTLDVCLTNLEGFSRSYHMSARLRDSYSHLDLGTSHYVPFQHIHNTLLCDAAVSWCRVFGSNSEDLHWKKIVAEHDDFKKHLINWSGMSESEYKEYRKSILVFRNKVASHFDPEHFSVGTTPYFEVANQIANKAYMYLSALDDQHLYRMHADKTLDNYGRRSADSMCLRLKA